MRPAFPSSGTLAPSPVPVSSPVEWHICGRVVERVRLQFELHQRQLILHAQQQRPANGRRGCAQLVFDLAYPRRQGAESGKVGFGLHPPLPLHVQLIQQLRGRAAPVAFPPGILAQQLNRRATPAALPPGYTGEGDRPRSR